MDSSLSQKDAEVLGGSAAPLAGLHARVLDRVGLAICSGELPPGSVIRSEEFEERFGVSRSVVREVVRVLAAMGMAESRRRVGVQILPATRWNLYDPQIIRWRLAGGTRVPQLRTLTELRSAVEPAAAALAAERASQDEKSQLMRLAGELWAAGHDGDPEEFLRADIRFHTLLLAASGNDMFAQLAGPVTEVLVGRSHYGLTPDVPHQEALQLHLEVAASVQRGAAEDARQAVLRILSRTMVETTEFWSRHACPAPHDSGGAEPDSGG
jgi:DNA-binding FadR family transcriptional regulator